MTPYAQTNLQLWRELVDAGWRDEELVRARRGYELAMRLFSARYRANGKPFVAHLVGTASVLRAHEAPVDVVLAGLLHAAYAQGDFGGARRGMNGARRRRVRAAIGEAAEALVVDYTHFRWRPDVIAALAARREALSPKERQVVVMRLANELEDHLDLGMAFGAKPPKARGVALEAAPLVVLARGLGLTRLADALAAAYEQHDAAEVPESLRASRRSSEDVPPPSFRRRSLPALAHLARRLRRLTK